MPDSNSRLVYSTDGQHIVDKATTRARKPAPIAKSRATLAVPNDGVVRVQRTSKAHGGKTVTMVTGLPANDADLEAMLKVLKQLCGAGGTRDGSTLEIQGDHRGRVQAKLEALGHRVKLAGG